MVLDGMVQMGEYSEACVCKEKNKTSSSKIEDNKQLLASGSVAAGSSAVFIQMQRATEQHQHHHQ